MPRRGLGSKGLVALPPPGVRVDENHPESAMLLPKGSLVSSFKRFKHIALPAGTGRISLGTSPFPGRGPIRFFETCARLHRATAGAPSC